MTETDFSERILRCDVSREVPDYCITANNIVRTKMLIRVWEMAKKPISMLDVGCGTCWMWIEFLREVGNIDFYGFDVNEKSIAQARTNLQRFSENIKCADIKEMPNIFRQKFDVVVSHAVLEHVYPRKLFIENICSSLKDDGVILLSYGSDHFKQSLRTDIRNKVSQLLAAVGIEKYYAKQVDEAEILGYLKNNKMKLVEKRYYSLVQVKKVSKLIKNEQEKKRFCLLWSELEERLNPIVGAPVLPAHQR